MQTGSPQTTRSANNSPKLSIKIAAVAALAFAVLLVYFTWQMSFKENSSENIPISIRIIHLMEKYFEAMGGTIVTGEICDVVSEASLRQAPDFLPDFEAEIWNAGPGHPFAPPGSTLASFKRDAQSLRIQELMIAVSDSEQYCEATIFNVSGL
ncbi:hypothetical protein [Devosia sp. SL43]|uniref:hypothetical protein n=1 Tax=Devosia sp. SL43 TaxID=2806348 RepID=UPI001F4352BB|nr:hypothetical protein [Devosia sp. SL43]UJW84456.1 hypothetical protein IM737_13585 [Devosia sp. SL43]